MEAEALCTAQVRAGVRHPDLDCQLAIIHEHCDLVITSDTAVAHLSAGMGHPTWLLLKQVPEWRWGLEGDSSGCCRPCGSAIR
jgi:ADP-heptose:LPS heptosyltransferase